MDPDLTALVRSLARDSNYLHIQKCTGIYEQTSFSGQNISLTKDTCTYFHSLPACGKFCHLLIFLKKLDPNQACQNIGPDLDLNV